MIVNILYGTLGGVQNLRPGGPEILIGHLFDHAPGEREFFGLCYKGTKKRLFALHMTKMAQKHLLGSPISDLQSCVALRRLPTLDRVCCR